MHVRNVHFRVEEDSILDEFEAGESSSPNPRKIDENHVIYEPRGLRWIRKIGRSVLCDFGFGKETYTDDIQPDIYRVPEIIMDIL